MSINSINPIASQQANQGQQVGQANTVKPHHHHGQRTQDSNSPSTTQTSPQDILELGTQKNAPVTYQNPRITRTKAS